MTSINIISEEAIRKSIEVSNAQDAENSLKWLLMIKRMDDARTPNTRNHYKVRLFDNPLPDNSTFKLADADTAQNVLNNLTKDMEISDGGVESSNSIYLGFYAD